MGKTRSSRRMRNCKSRNKRGGKLSLFQSDLLTSFKSAVRHGVTSPSYQAFDTNPTVELDDDMKTTINDDLLNYDSFTTQTLKKFVLDQNTGLAECNADKVKLLKEQINDESPKRKAYYLYALDKICEAHAASQQAPLPAVASPHSQAFGDTFQQGQPGQPGQVPIPSGQPGTVVDSLGAPMNRAPNPLKEKGGFKILPSAQGGSKSRRRHRRGRTLHKRRKSSKVRKTRRTHSRTRR